MKFQKMDQKQVPQVIALGVLTVGILGWAGMQWFGGNSASAAAKPKDEAQVASADTQAAAPDAGTTGEPGQPGTAPALTVPGGYNPDPFRGPAAKKDEKEAQPAPPAPSVRVERSSPGPLPGAGDFGPLPRVGGTGPAPVEPPPAPVRPTLAVTGIIDVEDGSDMALVEMGQSQRIVQVGDMVDAYKVKKIDLNGLLLVNGKDRFYAALASTEKEAGKS